MKVPACDTPNCPHHEVGVSPGVEGFHVVAVPGRRYIHPVETNRGGLSTVFVGRHRKATASGDIEILCDLCRWPNGFPPPPRQGETPPQESDRIEDGVK